MASIVKYNAALQETRSVNDDMKEQALQIWHQLQWEKLLIPGPSCIAITGKLTIVGLFDKITLVSGSTPYKNLRSDDFRTCVVQLRNAVINAFRESYSNMDSLHQACSLLMGLVNDILSIILEVDMEDLSVAQRNATIVRLLPGKLEDMLKAVTKCEKFVVNTVVGFEKALFVAQDLQEATTLTFGHAEKQTKELELLEKQLKIKVDATTERQKLAKTFLEDAKKSKDKADAMFERSMNSLPNGLELVALQAGEKLTELAGQAGNMYLQKHMNLTNAAFAAGSDLVTKGAGVGLGKLGEKDTPAPGTAPSTTGSAASKAAEVNMDDPVFLNADFICQALVVFANVTTGGTGGAVDWNAVIAAKGQRSSLGYVIAQFEDFAGEDYGKFKEALEAKHITSDALAAAKELQELSKDRDNARVAAIVKEVAALSKRADKVSAAVALKLRKPAVSTPLVAASDPPPPAQSSGDKAHQSAASIATANAQFSITKAEAQLASSKECYEKANQAMMDLTKELGEFNVQLKSIDPQKIEWSRVRAVLNQAVDHLSTLIFNLNSLAEFFIVIRNSVQEIMTPRIKSFSRDATIQLESLGGMTFDSFAKKSFAKDSVAIGGIVWIMSQIGKTYKTMYDSQMTEGMLLLSNIPITPGPDVQARIAESGDALQAWAEGAGEGMREILSAGMRDFNKRLGAQQAQLTQMAAHLPPPPPQMKEIAQEAKEEEVAAETKVIKKKAGFKPATLD